jgi:hypothetical protein
MEDLFHRIREKGGIFDIEEQLITVNHLFDLQDVAEMKENEKRYLR